PAEKPVLLGDEGGAAPASGSLALHADQRRPLWLPCLVQVVGQDEAHEVVVGGVKGGPQQRLENATRPRGEGRGAWPALRMLDQVEQKCENVFARPLSAGAGAGMLEKLLAGVADEDAVGAGDAPTAGDPVATAGAGFHLAE